MRLNLSVLGTAKLVLHTLQGLLIFIAGCICIAMFTKTGTDDGRGKYFFALCFLTIPALIYLAAVPMWPRTQKFAKGFIFAAVDVVYTIMWLAAFAGMIAWTRAGIRKGAEERSIPFNEGNCTTFPKDSSEAKCKLGYSTIGMGVVIFLTFIATSIISGLYVRKQMKESMSEPWLSDKSPYAPPGGIEAGKDPIWSADTQDIDDPSTGYGAQHNTYDGHRRSDSSGRHTERGTGNKEEDEYELLHGTETDDGHHPGRPWSDQHPPPPQKQYVDTGYHGAGASNEPAWQSPSGYNAPNALSPSDYGDMYSPVRNDQPVTFPSAPQGYDGGNGKPGYR